VVAFSGTGRRMNSIDKKKELLKRRKE